VTEETMSKLRIAPRGTPPQSDLPKDAPLTDAARDQLGMLVTEVRGVAKVLRADYNIVGDDEDLYSAVSMWVDRIAHDLGAMECRRYPAESEGAK
jgi:hypothetical protein